MRYVGIKFSMKFLSHLVLLIILCSFVHTVVLLLMVPWLRSLLALLLRELAQLCSLLNKCQVR